METPRKSPDPADTPPNERERARGSRAPNVGPWLVVMLILIAGAAAYVIHALATI